MADTTVNIGTSGIPKGLWDIAADASEYADKVQIAGKATSVSAETVQANAESVSAGSWSTINATATSGKRWALFRVLCNKAHTVEFYGDDADFSAITTAARFEAYTYTGSDNSSTIGDLSYLPVAACAYAGVRVRNDDGSNAATITVGVRYFD